MSNLGYFFTESPPVGLRIAQVVGITTSAYLLGQNCYISYGSVPAIMKAPAPLAVKQWAQEFRTGLRIGPPLAIISALATGYTAYHQDPSSLPFKLNIAATILFPSIIPFTFAFIAPTNNKLLAKERSLAGTSLEDKSVEVGIAKAETTNALLDKWATLNLARALLIAAGSLCAAWAAVSKREVIGYSEMALGTGANRLG